MIFVIAVIMIGAVLKIRKDKKNGGHCSACPYSKSCPSQTSCTMAVEEQRSLDGFDKP
ncbi:FeoB-associated Cys-rich membrane protein [Alkalibacter rhizosphaerae]|uniref:FeoB-associated Cys-rich membrane protein n=1 Tax=Alkalibacter rhizosphaerae TaxID=2815577 RepID=UPI001FEE517E|nr:FeoB-associated Cys-rich membrane protein [Alkalibacter rhizosphaerae]